MMITLGEKQYQGKVTLDTTMRIEQSLGMSIVKATQTLSEGALTTSQIITIITHTIRSGGNDVSEKEIGKDLWDAGLAEGLKVVGAILAHVLSGGSEDDEGNGEKAEGLL